MPTILSNLYLLIAPLPATFSYPEIKCFSKNYLFAYGTGVPEIGIPAYFNITIPNTA